MLWSNAEGENVCNLHTITATGLKDRHGYMRVKYTEINKRTAIRYQQQKQQEEGSQTSFTNLEGSFPKLQ